jgi:hypothetical protein
MEIAQRAYLIAEQAPWTYDPNNPARTALAAILNSLDQLGRSLT